MDRLAALDPPSKGPPDPGPSGSRPGASFGLILAALAWASLAVAGMATVWKYELRQGTPARSSARWPEGAGISRAPGLATLVVAIHPHCPCTRATIAELSRIMTRCEGNLAAFVLVLRPEGEPPGWERSDLFRTAARIPGVRVLPDDDGVRSARFGAATSGQTILFDATGKVVFSGGITGSRGHEGDNPGESAVISWVTRGASEITETPVFGCALAHEPPKAASRG